MTSPQPNKDDLSPDSDTSEDEVKSKYGAHGTSSFVTPTQENSSQDTPHSNDNGEPPPKMGIAECCTEFGSDLLVTGDRHMDSILQKLVNDKREAVEMLREKERALEEAKLKLEEKDLELENLRRDNKDVNEAKEGLEEKLKEAEECKKKAQLQCESLSNEVENLKLKVDSLNVQVSELTEEVKQLKKQSEDDKAKVQERLDAIEEDGRSERAEHQIRDQEVDDKLQQIIRMLEEQKRVSGQRNISDGLETKSYGIGSKKQYKDKGK